jgi:hypothetical protein
MPLILPGNVGSATAGAFSVANSCRFNDGDSAYMHKTPGSDGNRQQFTFSCWVKRATISSGVHSIINAQHGASSTHGLRFNSDDKLDFHYYAGGYQGRLETTRVFRDPSAWYNIIAIWDTPNATANSRMRLIINGVEETAFDTRTNPGSEYNGQISWSTKVHHIGDENTSNYFDGYIAEAVLIDGSVLAATSFGEFDSDSPTIWKPIDVSGLTFGTNGFYLDFEDSSNLGNDANGGTDLTEVNLAATDQCTDSPTNNFCTMNPLDNYHQVATFSEGNCKIVTNADKESFLTGTMGVSSGKWYYEVKCVTASTQDQMGFTDTPSTAYNDVMQNTTDGRKGFVYRDHSNVGAFRVDGGTQITTNYDDWTDGDVLGVYIDLDNLEAYVSKNGTLQNSGTGQTITAASSTKGFYLPAIGDEAADSFTAEVNFGNPVSALSSAVADANGYGQFEYSPSGTFDGASKDFLAICTKNLGSDGG